MIGLGIDTGGTYTDAVIYDLSQNKILASAKSLTTKKDLKIGIQNVFAKLPLDLLKSCQTLSLSTTLATNACVENRGGNGKLVLIGFNRETLEHAYKNYGYDSLDDIYLLECRIHPSPAKSEEPDWEQFRADMKQFAKGCDCVSIVQLFAKEHHGSYEKKAAQILQEAENVPVILGHSLFPDRDTLRRGAGALLNARLIPVIHDFLKAIKKVLTDYQLELPILIMRSDGNLMSDKYTYLHPVETLLCGPAASVMGAKHLTTSPHALVIDMGGTTTDISIIKDQIPYFVEGGIQIENWKTFVKGLYVDTFALGGDTAVHFAASSLYLDNYRVLPLCVLSKRYPSVLPQLQELERYHAGHPENVHEFFVLLKEPDDYSSYTDMEIAICEVLKDGPLRTENLAKKIGTDFYGLKTARLEKESIILKSGLTPSDIMHIRGDYTEFDREASLAASEFVSHCTNQTVEDLCQNVYDLVEKRLYCNLVRILLHTEYGFFQKEEPSAQILKLIEKSYADAKSGEEHFFSTQFHTSAILIGIGAPIHIFLEPVARMLNTLAIVPEHAAVANAVGAIVGNLASSASVEIKPDADGTGKYCVTSAENTAYFIEYEDALEFAQKEGAALSCKALIEKGGQEPFSTTVSLKRAEAPVEKNMMFLSEQVIVTATGKVFS